MRVSNIIFDFDLTIGELVIDWDEWRKGLARLLNEFDPDQNHKWEDVRHGNQNEYIQKYGPEFQEALNKRNQELEEELVTDFIPNNEILDFIRTTDKNLYVWSSNSLATVKKYLTAYGTYEKFQEIVTRNDTYFLKPDLEGFSKIYDSNQSLDNYLLVGDSPFDQEAAKGAGIQFVHVRDFKS